MFTRTTSIPIIATIYVSNGHALITSWNTFQTIANQKRSTAKPGQFNTKKLTQRIIRSSIFQIAIAKRVIQSKYTPLVEACVLPSKTRWLVTCASHLAYSIFSCKVNLSEHDQYMRLKSPKMVHPYGFIWCKISDVAQQFSLITYRPPAGVSPFFLVASEKANTVLFAGSLKRQIT